MLVLLSDGAGLTSRQCATLLARAGHQVEAVSPESFCLCRLTRHVRAVHHVPALGDDPFGWLEATLDIAARRGADLLLPVQEQVTVMSLARDRIEAAGVLTAVPDFGALAQVQDKVSAHRTLVRAGVPQPPAVVATTRAELEAVGELPAFVKTPIGTASAGVCRVSSRAQLRTLAARYEREGLLGTDGTLATDGTLGTDGALGTNRTVGKGEIIGMDGILEAIGVSGSERDFEVDGVFEAGRGFEAGGVLVQQAVSGPLVMVQAVFAHGELVAFHACQRVREGVSGGASHKLSLPLPEAREHIARLGAELRWHGALSADLILAAEGPRSEGVQFIDVNPRLVEPVNAFLSGVDLVGALVEVARSSTGPSSTGASSTGASSTGASGTGPSSTGRPQQAGSPGRSGVRTHQLLLAVLGAAQRGGRRAVARELRDAALHRGDYRDSLEELTPLQGDLLAGLPVAVTALATLVRPITWRHFAAGGIGAYSVTPAAWRELTAGYSSRAPASAGTSTEYFLSTSSGTISSARS